MQKDHSLQNLNSFGIDAKARLFAAPSDEEGLAGILEESPPESVALLLLGEGSNLLFTKDFDGLVIQPSMKGITRLDEDDKQVWVSVGAGENWDQWVEYSLEQDWYGLENLSLIPGSVGAAPVQNIGAYGTELKDHLAWVEAWDLKEGQQLRIKREDCLFRYRNSIFKTEERGRYLISRVVFSLEKKAELKLNYGNIGTAFREAGGSTALDLRKVVMDIRRQKLPDHEEYGNAGSFFKNPVVNESLGVSIRQDYPDMPSYPEKGGKLKIPAAWLIERSGWKGKRKGAVGTWPTQPLVIVNYGGATGMEILEFSQGIMNDVQSRFGISLEREVNVV